MKLKVISNKHLFTSKEIVLMLSAIQIRKDNTTAVLSFTDSSDPLYKFMQTDFNRLSRIESKLRAVLGKGIGKDTFTIT